MKPSEIVREAKSLLFERGWSQRDFEGADGALCLRGALSVAFCGNAMAEAYGNPAEEVVADGCGYRFFGGWNDDPARKFSEVIDALDRAEKFALLAEESDA